MEDDYEIGEAFSDDPEALFAELDGEEDEFGHDGSGKVEDIASSGDELALMQFGDGGKRGEDIELSRRVRPKRDDGMRWDDVNDRRKAEAELLAFYRERVKAFEGERADFNKRLNEVEISTKEMHR